MRRTILSTAVLAALATTGRAAPDDADVAKARAEFEAILVPSMDDRTGPSIHARVCAFLSHGADVAVQVEREMWDASHRDDTVAYDRSLEIERTICFLHGRPQRRFGLEFEDSSGFDILGGAVVRRTPTIESYRGPSIETHLPISFEKLVESAPLRPTPAPTAADLLVAAAGPDVRSARDDLAVALGEACANDAAARAELVKRAKAQPENLLYVRAVGRAGAPEAVEFLTDALLRGVDLWRKDGGDELLRRAADALAHADAARLRALIPVLPKKARPAAARAFGRDWLLLRDLESFAAATDPDVRRSALFPLLDVEPWYERWPRDEDAHRLTRAFLAAAESDDKRLREAADEATYAMFYGWNRGPIESSGIGGDGVMKTEKGARVGSYCSTTSLLHRLDADLTAGRLVFPSASARLVDKRPRTTRKSPNRARSDAADTADAGAWEIVPIHVDAAWTPKGMHLRFRNEAKTPLAIDPVGMQYGVADKVTVTTQAAGEAPRSETQLRLGLGFIREKVSIPAACLVTLKPGEVYECDLPVRDDLRGCGRLFVELSSDMPIAGAADAPLVTFGSTLVR